MDYFISGPGNGAINNSMRNNAKKLVENTVLNTYFNNAWNNRNKNHNYAIWNENGRMSGFAFVHNRGDKWYVSLIGARPGQGIGTRLMTRIIENAKNRGVKKIKLDSVTNAFKFYTKLGFKVKSVNDEHIIMYKKLGQESPVKKSPSPPKRVKEIRRSPRIASRKMVKK